MTMRRASTDRRASANAASIRSSPFRGSRRPTQSTFSFPSSRCRSRRPRPNRSASTPFGTMRNSARRRPSSGARQARDTAIGGVEPVEVALQEPPREPEREPRAEVRVERPHHRSGGVVDREQGEHRRERRVHVDDVEPRLVQQIAHGAEQPRAPRSRARLRRCCRAGKSGRRAPPRGRRGRGRGAVRRARRASRSSRPSPGARAVAPRARSGGRAPGCRRRSARSTR